MNVTMSLPVLKDDYEYTGEYRNCRDGEFIISRFGLVEKCVGNTLYPKIVVRKKKNTIPMTAYDLAMLPQGTAFVHKTDEKLFNPYFSDSGCIIYINGKSLKMCFAGYILPNTTEILPFTKEV